MRLPASLDLTRADWLHGELVDWIARGHAVALDGSMVERISTPCLQLLVAAAVSARLHGLSFQIATPSAALAGAVRDLALIDALGMEQH